MGYEPDKVLGRNCRHLQWHDTEATNAEANASMRKAFKAGEDVHVVLRNYKADGTAFGNSITILCLKDKKGAIRWRLGVIKIIKAPTLDPEDVDRKKKRAKIEESQKNKI